MNFSEFIDIIINNFNQFLQLVSTFFDDLMENNFIKLILFIAILYFVIYMLSEIINLIKKIFSTKKEASKNKKSKTDIE